MKRESLLVVSTNGLAERIWFKMGLKAALRVVCADPKRHSGHL